MPSMTRFRLPKGARPSPFSRYHNIALIGERLLDDEAEHGMQNWVAPSEIARLLLIRRAPKPFPDHCEPSSFGILGASIPDLDGVLKVESSELPTPASPFLSLHLRPALLAGVTIVQRAGPEMLHMLRSHIWVRKSPLRQRHRRHRGLRTVVADVVIVALNLRFSAHRISNKYQPKKKRRHSHV